MRIKCAVCPDFDLCLECFSVGAEVTPHASSHAYRVVDSLTFPLFHPDWGVRAAAPTRELCYRHRRAVYGLFLQYALAFWQSAAPKAVPLAQTGSTSYL